MIRSVCCFVHGRENIYLWNCHVWRETIEQKSDWLLIDYDRRKFSNSQPVVGDILVDSRILAEFPRSLESIENEWTSGDGCSLYVHTVSSLSTQFRKWIFLKKHERVFIFNR